MKYYEETIKEFKIIIDQIHNYNTNLISALSLFAEEYKTNEIVSSAFARIIKSKIVEADNKEKIFFFYVLDDILKNVGHFFVDKFADIVKDLIVKSLVLCDKEERTKYEDMIHSWQNIFSYELLKEINNELIKLDVNLKIICNETLQSLPIIISKSKPLEDFVFQEVESINTENSLWEVVIPDYPLFPSIGVDPRLLRKWYSSNRFCNIKINEVSYKLHLNRLQPCIYIDNNLHAVRFYSKSVKILINELAVELPLVGVVTVRVNGRFIQISLGGPGHEIIIYGSPHSIPMDGKIHSRIVNGEKTTFQFILDHPILVRIMPAIPAFIEEWAWDGKFGSPKNLRLNPFNPMKPKDSLMNVEFRAPLENVDLNLGLEKPNDDLAKEKQDLKRLQKTNLSAIVELYRRTLNQRSLLASVTSKACYQLANDWMLSESASCHDYDSLTMSANDCKLKVENEKVKYYFDQLTNFENHLVANIPSNGKLFTIHREELFKFRTVNRSSLWLLRGTAEICGSQILYNEPLELLSNTEYELLSFTGCKVAIENEIKNYKICNFFEDNNRWNILLNIHDYLETKRIDSVINEERGPRILIYGPGIESLTMSSVSRLLVNYAARSGESVALVNLDTTYNDSTLPNSISVNVVQSQFNNATRRYDNSEILVFNFGHCTPFINSCLYFEQLTALANLVNIRCENDNNLLRGGSVINGGSYHSLEITKKAVEIFEVNVLLVIGDKHIENIKTKLPSFVEMICIPKTGFDTGYCPKKVEYIRKLSVDMYFSTENDLYSHLISYSTVTFFATTEHCYTYRKIDPDSIAPNSIGVLSQAICEDQLMTSPVFLYCILISFSKSKSAVTVLSNVKLWPREFSFIVLSGNVWN